MKIYYEIIIPDEFFPVFIISFVLLDIFVHF